MCFPGAPLAAGAGLKVLGNASLGKQQAKAVGRRNDVLAAESARQEPMRAEASQRFDDVLAQVSSADPAAIEGERMTALSAGLDQPESDGTMEGGSNNRVVKEAVARALNTAIKKGHAQAKTMAKMGSFSDRNFENALALNDSGADLGMIAQNSGNSAAILPVELNAANNSFDPTMGDALSGLGDLSMAYGITDPFGTANRVVGGPLKSKNFLGAIS